MTHHIRTVLRSLARQKGFTFINVVGLSTGLAASVLMLLFVRNELSFDRHLEHGSELYRVILSADVAGQSVLTTNTPAPMAATLIDEIPEVVDAVRIGGSPATLVAFEDRRFKEDAFFLADPVVFEMFSIELVAGEANSALSRPGTIVISEAIAVKYFGQGNPIGKVLNVGNRAEFEVTGVMRLPDGNTHFRPELIGSFVSNPMANNPSWLQAAWFTYVATTPGTDPALIEGKLEDVVQTHVGPEVERTLGQSFADARAAGLRYEYLLEPVPEIYLHSTANDQIGPTGDFRYVQIMSAIALFLLFLAGVNFVNLATARASARAHEVGLRKALGSGRAQLIGQFLGESMAVTVFSMLFAKVILVVALPAFNAFAGTSLSPESFAFGLLAATGIVVGLLAGIYPAFILSRYRPAEALRGAFSTSSGGAGLRRALVVFQFSVSVVLIIGTGVVAKQLGFMQSRDLGFDSEQVVVLPIETPHEEGRVGAFLDEVVQHTGIVRAAAASGLPGPGHLHQENVFRREESNPEDVFVARVVQATTDYAATLGLQIVAGRDFSRDRPADREGFLVSEATAREMGFPPDELIGKPLTQVGAGPGSPNRIGPVLGVFRDAHFESLHNVVRPVVIGMLPQRRYVPVRIAADRTEEVLEFLKEKWTAFEPGYPFTYYFLDDDYRQFYEQDERLGSVFGYFSGLAVLIACLGLFGLASYVTARRTKEIGVRKVLGASAPSIARLLSFEFMKLVLIACIVAFPVGWFVMDAWLEDFAYRIDLGPAVFILSGAVALAIAGLTVSYLSVRAAVSNPIEALHHE